ncbi:hypothetical protein CHCC20335_3335 [Bacillus paralicheniformis]|nr:hypothetical protein CHCC20335_3335 [Bacillus paralicheniformis]
MQDLMDDNEPAPFICHEDNQLYGFSLRFIDYQKEKSM